MTKNVYKTAQGKTLDMGSLVLQNEHVRAVGNMKVNSRGDTIDEMGNVIKPVTEKVNEQYVNTVKNASSLPRQKTPPPQKTQRPKVTEELTEAEREMDAEFEDDLEVEKIKAQENK